MRQYNILDMNAKQAINETFLQNVKSRKNRLNVNELIRAYNNNSAEKREKMMAINKIFPPKNYGQSKWNKAAAQMAEKTKQNKY
jgi:hypothetical protein